MTCYFNGKFSIAEIGILNKEIPMQMDVEYIRNYLSIMQPYQIKSNSTLVGKKGRFHDYDHKLTSYIS